VLQWLSWNVASGFRSCCIQHSVMVDVAQVKLGCYGISMFMFQNLSL
jgi:hypothetical protein